MARKEEIELPAFIDRTDFLHNYWDYKPGEHVTFLAPTQSGKTTFIAQLVGVSATPELPAIVLVMKPRDRTVDKIVKQLGFEIIRKWPPPVNVWRGWRKKPSGWVLWPKHTFDDEVDDPHFHDVFKKVLMDAYKTGDRIVVADETFGLTNELHLGKKLDSIWTRGAGMGCGLWAASQRPAMIPQNAYAQAEHIFIAYDPEERSRKRYGEIGGVDGKMVEATVLQLEKYHWLYIRRTGRVSAIIGA